MSDWNTHLYCANIVNESLKFEGRELSMFLFGNILPDVNMGWIIDPDVKKSQKETHFDAMGQDYFWAPRRFYEKYEAEIKSKNPLFLGYLFHLWLDVSFMTNFVGKIPMSDMISKHYEIRQNKWNDCGLFIKGYHCDMSSKYIRDICEASEKIEEVEISQNDLSKALTYINNNNYEFAGEKYTVYTESELKQFYQKVADDYISWVFRTCQASVR